MATVRGRVLSVTLFAALAMTSDQVCAEADAQLGDTSRVPPPGEHEGSSPQNATHSFRVVTSAHGKYVGEFRDGVYDGFGLMVDSDGVWFVGTFAQGEYVEGSLSDAEGTTWVGRFRAGKINGEGAQFFAQGGWYVGNFSAGKYHGLGTITARDGRRERGDFELGRPVGPRTALPPLDVQRSMEDGVERSAKVLVSLRGLLKIDDSEETSRIAGERSRCSGTLIACAEYALRGLESSTVGAVGALAAHYASKVQSNAMQMRLTDQFRLVAIAEQLTRLLEKPAKNAAAEAAQIAQARESCETPKHCEAKCDQGEGYACTALGLHYRDSEPPQLEGAHRLLVRACDAGVEAACRAKSSVERLRTEENARVEAALQEQREKSDAQARIPALRAACIKHWKKYQRLRAAALAAERTRDLGAIEKHAEPLREFVESGVYSETLQELLDTIELVTGGEGDRYAALRRDVAFACMGAFPR